MSKMAHPREPRPLQPTSAVPLDDDQGHVIVERGGRVRRQVVGDPPDQIRGGLVAPGGDALGER